MNNRFSGMKIGHALPVFRCQKPSVAFDFICSTISKDNTSGESARKSELLADYGKRLRRHELMAVSNLENEVWGERGHQAESDLNISLPGAGMDPNNMDPKFYEMGSMVPRGVPNGMRPPSPWNPRPSDGFPTRLDGHGSNGQMVPRRDQGAGGVSTYADPKFGRHPSGRDPNFGRLNSRG
jgi:hypothetical protein